MQELPQDVERIRLGKTTFQPTPIGELLSVGDREVANETLATPQLVSPFWRILIRDTDVDPVQLLTAAALPEDLFASWDTYITTEEAQRLWRTVHRLYGVRFVQQAIAAFTIEGLCTCATASLCQPTVGQSIRFLTQFPLLHMWGSLAVAMPSPDEFEVRFASPELAPTHALLQVALFLEMYRKAARHPIRPRRVALTSQVLPDELRRVLLAREIWRGAPRNVITLSTEDARLPLITASEDIGYAIVPELRKQLANHPKAAVRFRVQGLLYGMLDRGLCRVQDVAEHLGTSPRTLQRQLHEEGTSFQSILKRTRYRLAMRLLRATELTATEISCRLGYREPNSFLRAFREWTGYSPEEMRKNLLGA